MFGVHDDFVQALTKIVFYMDTLYCNNWSVFCSFSVCHVGNPYLFELIEGHECRQGKFQCDRQRRRNDTHYNRTEYPCRILL